VAERRLTLSLGGDEALSIFPAGVATSGRMDGSPLGLDSSVTSFDVLIG